MQFCTPLVNSKITKKIFAIFTRVCRCCLGHGCIQRISQRPKNHPLYRPQAAGENGTLTYKDDEKITSCPARTRLCYSIQKGAIMPADYLPRLPSTNENQLAEITQCFNPFQPELLDLQKTDSDLQNIHHFRTKGEWPAHMTKADTNYLQHLAAKLYQDANKIVWIRLDYYKYPLYFYLRNSARWHSAKPTITNLADTMQH
jgi:hypothetical protein